MIHLLLACLAAPLGSQAPASTPSPEDFAIVGAHIEFGDGREMEEGTVIVKGGVIASIQEGSSAPAGLKSVSGKGKRLYPGFIDGLSTRGLKTPPVQNLTPRPDTGTTAPSSLWEGHRKGITPEWRAFDNLEYSPLASTYRQGLATTMITPTRGAMRGTAVILDLLDADVKDRVLKEDGASAFSFRTGAGAGYPTNILGTVALTRQTLLDAKGYLEGVFDVPEKDPPAWQAALRALGPVVKGETPVVWEANTVREIERAISFAKEFGLRLTISGGREAGLTASLLAREKVPVILSVDPGQAPSVAPQAESVPQADRQPQEFRQERYDRWLEAAKGDQALAEAGVPFCFGSDASLASFMDGVRARIGRGLSRTSALKALTTQAANILGLSQVGLIAPGRKASLVLMSGPFDSKDSVVERLWIGGRPVLVPSEASK